MKRAGLVLLLLVSSGAWADSWLPPSKETYVSQDKTIRLTVIPRDLESAYAYFDDKVKGREPAGAPDGKSATSATGVLERRGPSGSWQTAWKKPLTNEIAPADVIVANEGRGFVTFDNWHSIGHGSNAIAIYSSDGTLVRKFGLEELFPDWFVAALPRSVSSIHWRGDPRFSSDGTELIVPVVQPTHAEEAVGENIKLDLAIRIQDGEPVGLETVEWEKALKDAAVTANANCASQREWIRKWNAPLVAPATGKEEDWHHYLRETQYRSKWSEEPPVADTTVLRLANASDFQASLRWLEENLTEQAAIDHDLRVIGSPDLARLTSEIERIAHTVRPGQLKGVDLVIVAAGQGAERIRSALKHTGANLETVDPKQPFPQIEQRKRDEADLVTCRAPEPSLERTSWWLALPFLLAGGGLFLRRGV